MRKNKLVWVVRYKDEFEGGDNWVRLSPTTEPKMDGYGGWYGDGETADPLCYAFFKRATGLSLEMNTPVRVRFSAEIYKP